MNQTEKSMLSSPDINTYTEFDAMPLPFDVLKGIYSYGFEKPSRIQSTAIVPLINGRDVVAQSQSGTGKTGAFVISTLAVVYNLKEKLRKEFLERNPSATASDYRSMPLAIIMSNTQQLAEQTYNVFNDMRSNMDITAELCIGASVAVEQNVNNISRGTIDVLIGTPGRLIDLMECRRAFDPENIEIFIIDEVDVMMTGSFSNNLERLLSRVRPNIIKGLFSATISDSTKLMIDSIVNDPVRIFLERSNELLSGINQYQLQATYDGTSPQQVKCIAVHQIISTTKSPQTIIYVSNAHKAVILLENLKKLNPSLEIGVVYSTRQDGTGMTPATRDATLQDFRRGHIRVLISTDLTSRGFDAQHVKMVINFDMPSADNKHGDYGPGHTYLHRIGRCGRYGRKGTAISLIGGSSDQYSLKCIEDYFGIEIPYLPKDFTI